MDFQGAFAPGSGVTFPLTLTAVLQQDGSAVPGGAMLHSFHTSPDIAELAIHVPVEVTSAPSTLQIVVTGDSFSYSANTMTIRRLRDVPT